MKKLIIAITLLFSINAFAEDFWTGKTDKNQFTEQQWKTLIAMYKASEAGNEKAGDVIFSLPSRVLLHLTHEADGGSLFNDLDFSSLGNMNGHVSPAEYAKWVAAGLLVGTMKGLVGGI